jgi:hypothetical protein
MPDDAYRRPPAEIDMAGEEFAIRKGSLIAIVATIFGFIAAYQLAPLVADLPQARADRLAFAALCWALPCFVLLVAILMVSTTRRYSPEDIGGQAARGPSDRLAVKAAFLQNTLEQTVLAAGFYFALAAVAGGAWLALLPVAAGLFVIGRIFFYRGYRAGAGGRALGMALTMIPATLGYPLVCMLALTGAG